MAHVGGALDAPYDVRDVDDLVHRHSHDGALWSSEKCVDAEYVGDALDDPHDDAIV
jgi:hypothetical protein